MIVNRSYYTCTSLEKSEAEQVDQILAKLRFNADDPIYEGHFPGNPITPGVCLVQSINDVVMSQYPGYKPSLIKKCKFTAVHNPNVVPNVHADIQIKHDEGVLNISATIKSEEDTYVKYSAQFVN